MPEAHRENGYRFSFYSNENDEPAHIHVRRAGNEAKYWLFSISLNRNYGFSRRELMEIESIIRREHDKLLRKWDEHKEAAEQAGYTTEEEDAEEPGTGS